MGGRILREDVDTVRHATDIVAVVGERVALKRSGRQFSGLCPFHNERTPSFYVNPELGLYHCHGCQASGNVFHFLMRVDGLAFPDAVELCAQRAGISLRHEGAGRTPESGGQRRRLVAAHEAAVAFYHDLLRRGPEAGPARSYWRERGFDAEDALRFEVGLAPEGWDRLVRHLSREGFAGPLLVEAGLATRTREGRLIDRFRHRLMFPIHDQSGQPIGFGGRSLPGAGEPKYLNSPESPLYAKSRVLYNLHRAKGEILSRREVVLVEGYTDVIALTRAGVPHAVATCGTALGEGHLEVLRRYGTGTDPLRVVLAFDADAAGRAAGERGFEMYGRFHLDMRAAVLPEGHDPADLALGDPTAARRVVAEAPPLMEFKLAAVLGHRPLSDPESKARALRAAAAAVSVHPDPIARDIWSQWLADRLRVDKSLVDAEVARARSGNDGGTRRSAGPPSPRPAAGMPARAAKEAELVRVAVYGPEEESSAARRWPEEDLSDRRVVAVLRALDAAGRSVEAALEALDEEAAAYLASCVVDAPPVDDRASWAKEVLARLHLDRVRAEESSSRIDDLDDLTKRIALIQKRHALSGTP